jgi:nitrogen fixation NifU-like protein
MAYSDKVLDHYENPRNVGSLDKNDPHVGTGMVGAPACGDVMKVSLKMQNSKLMGVAQRSPQVHSSPNGLKVKH